MDSVRRGIDIKRIEKKAEENSIFFTEQFCEFFKKRSKNKMDKKKKNPPLIAL